MKKQISRIVAGAVSLALAVALCPAVPALAVVHSTENVDEVKALIAPLAELDPISITEDNRAAIEDAQNAYKLLKAQLRAQLDNETPEGKPQSYGRYLEMAVWALNLNASCDNSTTLADGTYTEGFTSVSDPGKYSAADIRSWLVTSFVVENGKAFATIEGEGNYPKLRIGGKTYDGTVKKVDGQSVAVYERIPVDLNSTMTVAAYSNFAKNWYYYQVTTTIEEPTAAQIEAEKKLAEAQTALADAKKSGETETAALKAQLAQAQKDVVANSAVTLKSAKASKKKVTVKWAKSKVAEGYVVYRSMKKGKGFKAVKTIKSAKTVKFVDKKVKKGKKYFYKVRAFKTFDGAKVMSDWSTVMFAKAK